jgi:hypothetical protein
MQALTPQAAAAPTPPALAPAPATSAPSSASSSVMWATTPQAAAAPTPPSTLAPTGFVVLTWNVEGLTTGTKELVLLDLLVTNNVSVAAITETEVPSLHGAFDLTGYVSFLPQVEIGDKFLVIVYVRCDVALASEARLATDIMRDGLQAVWVRLDTHRGRPGMIVGGTYRQWIKWSPGGVLDRKIDMQREQIAVFLQQVEAEASSSRVLIVLGDVNLDAHRSADKSYRMRQMLLDFKEGMAKSGLTYHETGSTYMSHGHYAPSAAAVASALDSSAANPLAGDPSAGDPSASGPLVSAPSAPSPRRKPLAAVKTPMASALLAPSPTRKPLAAVKTPTALTTAAPSSTEATAPTTSALWAAATWAVRPLAALWAAAPSSTSSPAMGATAPLAANAAPPSPASSSAMRATTPQAAAAPTPPAKRSRSSAIDHVYSAGISPDVRLLPDVATDHRPMRLP